MVLQRQEGCVEDDTERDEDVEAGVGDQQVKTVLPAHPRVVPDAAGYTALAVPVWSLVWRRMRGHSGSERSL